MSLTELGEKILQVSGINKIKRDSFGALFNCVQIITLQM